MAQCNTCNPCSKPCNDEVIMLDCDSLIDKLNKFKKKLCTKSLSNSEMSELLNVIHSINQCKCDIEVSMNNLVQHITLPNVDETSEISSRINLYPAFSVDEHTLMYFDVLVNNLLHKYVLTSGKGEYGLDSGTLLNSSDIYLIYKESDYKVVRYEDNVDFNTTNTTGGSFKCKLTDNTLFIRGAFTTITSGSNLQIGSLPSLVTSSVDRIGTIYKTPFLETFGIIIDTSGNLILPNANKSETYNMDFELTLNNI